MSEKGRGEAERGRAPCFVRDQFPDKKHCQDTRANLAGANVADRLQDTRYYTDKVGTQAGDISGREDYAVQRASEGRY